MIFKTLNASTDVILNQSKILAKGIWSGDSPTLTTFYTGSSQTAIQKTYFYQVWNAVSTASGSQSQFAVAYGNRLGSGSATSNTDDEATKAIYSQMKLTVLNPGDTLFTFKSGSVVTESNSIYVLSINRARLKDSLDPGNWSVTLATLSGSSVPNSVHTGSNVKVNGLGTVVSLIDDSQITTGSVTISNAGPKYNIVSGTVTGGPYVGPGGYHYYGIVYPALGLMVFNGNELDRNVGFNTVTGSQVAGDNAFKLFTSISGAAAISTANAFTARNNEKRVSNTYFVRAFSNEFNYSNNPTFVTGSQGLIRPEFVGDPQTFISTIGLYNNTNELLAVAKVSRPLIKNFETELLVKVRLDY
jgi:hypothetical protein